MLEIMKRNKILTYAFLMAIPMTTGNIFSSCTDDFEKLNTSNIQVDPADLPFAAQCTEPMTYCYPPQQNMFQFWTNLTIDLYGGYFMKLKTMVSGLLAVSVLTVGSIPAFATSNI